MAKRAATKKRATRPAPAKSTAVTRIKTAPPVRAALGAGAAADNDGKLLTEGFITISIGDKKFELRGVVGDYLKVEYQVSFEEAESLDTLPNIIGGVAKALGIPNAEEFAGNLNAMLEKLQTVPLVKPAAEILANGVIKVTDLGIDTQAGIYQFGFGVDLAGGKTGDGSIALDAFGLLFTYTKPKDKDPA